MDAGPEPPGSGGLPFYPTGAVPSLFWFMNFGFNNTSRLFITCRELAIDS